MSNSQCKQLELTSIVKTSLPHMAGSPVYPASYQSSSPSLLCPQWRPINPLWDHATSHFMEYSFLLPQSNHGGMALKKKKKIFLSRLNSHIIVFLALIIATIIFIYFLINAYITLRIICSMRVEDGLILFTAEMLVPRTVSGTGQVPVKSAECKDE